jgi:peroxiredoxin
MKFFLIFAQFLTFTFLNVAFSQNRLVGKPVQNPEVIIEKLFDNLLLYKQDYLHLSEDFTAFNSAGKEITHKTFFEKYATGEYLPLRIKSTKSTAIYQLYEIPSTTNKDVATTLQQWGKLAYLYFTLEGQQIPPYNFNDLNNQNYTPRTTKGKIIVLNCWYLACQACRTEIPDLNKLVSRYKNRKDIVFLSLVFDSENEVRAFLNTHTFNYSVIAGKKKYLLDKFKIGLYPTNIIINKQGLITTVLNEETDQLAYALDREANK